MSTNASRVHDRIPVRIFFVILGAGALIALLALFIEPYFFQFYGDANSRLVQTRMILDSENPGLHWIGSVWLPLPQLLFLPFSLVNPLFSTGLAGFMVCMPLLAWSAVLLYRFLHQLTQARVPSALAALVYALNPNMLYISMTAMTETVALFFVIGALQQAHAAMSAHSGSTRLRALLLASLSAAGATLCRYEGWVFAGLLYLVLVGHILRYRMPDGRSIIELGLVTVCLWMGVLFWLLWNHVQFGDALYFNHAEYYSAAWQARNRPVRAQYYLQIRNVLRIYGVTAVAIFGYSLLAVSVLGAALLARIRPAGRTMAFTALLLIMPAFTLLSLYQGVAEMTEWWNSRYVLLLSPFVSLALASALAWWGGRGASTRAMIAAAVLLYALTACVQMPLQRGNVVTVADAAGGFYYMQTPHATAVAEYLRENYEGGDLLCATGSGQSHRILQPSGISTRHLVTGLNFELRNTDLDYVRGRFEWIVVGLDASPDGREIARHWISNAAALGKVYNEKMRNAYYIVYRKAAQGSGL